MKNLNDVMQRYRDKLIDSVYAKGEIVSDASGYYYFSPKETGALTSPGLAIIAAELDEKNKDMSDLNPVFVN